MADFDQLIRKLTLLIVDDDPAIVRVLQHVIERELSERVNVIAVTDPVAAMERIDQDVCDVLITDLKMPGVDGLSVLRFAKQRNAWTQVIFMTGHSTWNAIGEALESGASDYLVKPVDHQELVDLVRQAYARFARWQTAVGRTLDINRAELAAR